MDFSEKEYRTVRTRNIIYSEEEMYLMRIKGIYNCLCDSECVNIDLLHNLFNSNIDLGDSGLMDFAEKGERLSIITVIVFYDEYSRNMYSLKHQDLFNSNPELMSFYN